MMGFGQGADTFTVRAREVAGAMSGSEYPEPADSAHEVGGSGSVQQK